MRNLVERAAAITVLATALVASGAGHARASLMTYTETVTASGSLGSTTFTDATITFTQTADTANVVTNPISHSKKVVDTTATLVITGGDLASPLTASFTSATTTFCNPSGSGGLLGRQVGPFNIDILVLSNPAFATYDLTTPLGPISGPSGINGGLAVATTTAGDLTLDEAGTVTFQAVPEPSSLALAAVACATGLAIAAGRRPRRVGR